MTTGLNSIEQAARWLNQEHTEHEKKEAVSIETAYPSPGSANKADNMSSLQNMKLKSNRLIQTCDLMENRKKM